MLNFQLKERKQATGLMITMFMLPNCSYPALNIFNNISKILRITNLTEMGIRHTVDYSHNEAVVLRFCNNKANLSTQTSVQMPICN